MKSFVWILALALLPAAAAAGERPEWAFAPETTAPPPARKPADPNQVVTVPGSSRTYTLKQLEDQANPADWFPDEHGPMPEIVAHGKLPAVRACITCHVGNGHGHPENSRLPGGTAAYLERQLHDFKSGARAGTAPINMINFAKVMTDDEMKASAEYFAGLKTLRWTRVVETDTVPKTFLNRGMRLPAPDGSMEPISNRIIEVPEDPARVALRDPKSGFISYAPTGSLAKGKELVMNGGGGKTIACTVCHGPNLKGLGDVPGIAGRSALNIARQLYYFQNGERGGTSAALMKLPVEKLTADDMLVIAAYVTSLEP